jgi:hypothetical protein
MTHVKPILSDLEFVALMDYFKSEGVYCNMQFIKIKYDYRGDLKTMLPDPSCRWESAMHDKALFPVAHACSGRQGPSKLRTVDLTAWLHT